MISIPKARPLVSIVIPAYNHENFIEESIASVLNQSYKNIELVVVDDGSSDRTYERAVGVTCKLDGQASARRKIVRNERNLGVCKTLNRGLSLISGDYVFVLHSDNYLHVDCIDSFVAIAEQNQEFKGLFICDFYNVDLDGLVVGSYSPEFLGYGILDKSVLLKAIFAVSRDDFKPAPYFMARESMDRGGGFDETFGVEDFDFYIRWAVGPGMFRLPKKLYYFRGVPTSLGCRANEYADSLVPAMRKYESALGDSFSAFLLDTQLRTIKAFLDNGFYVLGIARAGEYLRRSEDFRSAYRVFAFSVSRFAIRVIKSALPKPVLAILRRVLFRKR